MARGPPRALLVFDEVVAGQYNPDGYEAAGAFVRQLKDSGVKRFKTFTQYRRHEHAWLDLIVPTYLPPGVRVTDVRYNLPVVVVREKAPAWARITGGVDGQGSIKYGIESDEFSQDWILALVERAITPHLRTGLDMVCRRVQMRLLEKVLWEFIKYKLHLPDSEALREPARHLWPDLASSWALKPPPGSSAHQTSTRRR